MAGTTTIEMRSDASAEECKEYAKAILGEHGAAAAVSLVCLGQTSETFQLTAYILGMVTAQSWNEDHPEKQFPEDVQSLVALGTKFVLSRYRVAAGGA